MKPTNRLKKIPAPTLVAALTPGLLLCPTTPGGVGTLQEPVEEVPLLIESTKISLEQPSLTSQTYNPLGCD
uniref:Uncharacterized protein n=1 Tax=uncultured Gemmatimonadales bacterium HF0500_22O06 TaxID=723615 RepID=E7C5E9_9BACT|nr:hypothetical protein [uncultured Gemmatimonadales bacterium HF0500_22O06]